MLPDTDLVEYGNISHTLSRHEWEVNNFSELCKKPGEGVQSPAFTTGNNGEFKWRLTVYPYGFSDSHQDYVSIFLDSDNDFDLNLNLTMIMTGFDGTEIMREQKEKKIRGCWHSGYPTFANRHHVIASIANLPDVIRIICEIHINPTDFARHSRSSNIQADLLKDFEFNLMNGSLSDIKIIVDKNEFKAHKAILASRSEVFKVMFDPRLSEKNVDKIEMTDFDDNIVKNMLQFIYLGKVDDLRETTAKELFRIADKYIIEGLQKMCSDYLCANVNIVNATELLEFAGKEKMERLATTTASYIATHSREIFAGGFDMLESMDSSSLIALIKQMEKELRAVHDKTHNYSKNYIVL